VPRAGPDVIMSAKENSSCGTAHGLRWLRRRICTGAVGLPWILEPLARAVTATPPHSAVLEAGCGTCNYANALAERFDDRRFHGFDRSGEMLAGARSRSHKVALVRADAESSFPYQDHVFELIYFVDVIHHIVKLSTLFAESSRTLLRDGTLIIVTDSEEDIRSRSLTHYFRSF